MKAIAGEQSHLDKTLDQLEGQVGLMDALPSGDMMLLSPFCCFFRKAGCCFLRAVLGDMVALRPFCCFFREAECCFLSVVLEYMEALSLRLLLLLLLLEDGIFFPRQVRSCSYEQTRYHGQTKWGGAAETDWAFAQ